MLELSRGLGYWRMSSSPQEESIPQQRAVMLPRARLERVEVLKEFQDEAKSGGGMARRDQLLAMLACAQELYAAGEPADCIVCYDTSRFSRATSIKTARYIDEFMDAGVCRVLTRERWFDFRKEEDRAIFLLQQDFTNNRFLRNLSAAVLRGKKDAAAAAFFTGGEVPYGFDRVLVDERGQVVARFPRGEKVRLRKQGWREMLAPIPEDDPDPARQLERQTAIWLYETFAARLVSYTWLAAKLNGDGVPPPGSAYGPRRKSSWREMAERLGKDKGWTPNPDDDPEFFTDPTTWTVPAVKRILTNPVFKGVARTGASGTGQYSRLVKGEVQEVMPGTRRTRDNDEGLILASLDHGGLVSARVWEAVQEKVKERATQKMRPRNGDYVLPSGILHCGHCGGRMYGNCSRPKRGKKVYEYRNYTCSAPNARPGTCKHYSVPEDDIVSILREQLLQKYLRPERLAGIEAALKARAEARHDRAPADVERLKARLASLEEDVKRARRRVLLAEDDATAAELHQGLSELVDERKRLEKQLQAARERTEAPAQDSAAQVEEAMRRVRALREELERAKGRKLGEAIGLLVTKAELFFEERHEGRKRHYPLVKAVLRVRRLLDDPGVSTNGAHGR
jgi:hypothetical protein